MTDIEAHGQAFQNGYAKGFEDGRRDRWTACDAILPQQQQLVLGCMDGTVTVLWYHGGGLFSTFAGIRVYADEREPDQPHISHWMDVPEAPSGGAAAC